MCAALSLDQKVNPAVRPGPLLVRTWLHKRRGVQTLSAVAFVSWDSPYLAAEAVAMRYCRPDLDEAVRPPKGYHFFGNCWTGDKGDVSCVLDPTDAEVLKVVADAMAEGDEEVMLAARGGVGELRSFACRRLAVSEADSITLCAQLCECLVRWRDSI